MRVEPGSAPGAIELQVKTVTMNKAGWRLLVTANTRVAEIKDLLLLETGASVANQLLVCGGKEMLDNCSMTDLGIQTSVVVGLIIRPTLLTRGGMDSRTGEAISAFKEAIANFVAEAIRQATALWRTMAEDDEQMERELQTAELTAMERSLADGCQAAEAALQYNAMDVEAEGWDPQPTRRWQH